MRNHLATAFRYIGLSGILALSTLIAPGAGAWTISEDFSKGTPEAKVSSMRAAGRAVYSNERALQGRQSARLSVLKGETGYGKWGGYFQHPKLLKAGDEIWFRVTTWFPAGFDYYSYSEGNRLKFLRIHTQSAKGANEGYNDIYIDHKGSATPFKFLFEGEQRWRNVGKREHLPRFDVWETYEFYVKLHPVPASAGGEAVVRFWKDGELLQEIRDRKTLKTATSVVDRSHLFTYWNGGAPKTQSMWVDSVVITSDQPAARDAHGNPYLGPVATPSPPRSPLLILGD